MILHESVTHSINLSLPRCGDRRGYIAIFYFTPFRAFEFAIGALVIWLPKVDRGKDALLARINSAVKLGFIGRCRPCLRRVCASFANCIVG